MPESATPSTYAERLEFARDRQRIVGAWEADGVMAQRLGISKSQFSEDKNRDTAPSSERTLAVAGIVGVDPGWLGFGAASAAPAPEGFELWLVGRRKRSPQPTVLPGELPDEDDDYPKPGNPGMDVEQGLAEYRRKKKAAPRKAANGNGGGNAS